MYRKVKIVLHQYVINFIVAYIIHNVKTISMSNGFALQTFVKSNEHQRADHTS